MQTTKLVQKEFEALLGYEGLFTLGSQSLHLRGSLEEPVGDDPQNRDFMRLPGNVTAERFVASRQKIGTYIPGIYGTHPLLKAEMINLPYAADLMLVVEGERLDVSQCKVEMHKRTLDLSCAVLERSLVWHTESGAKLTLRYEKFLPSGASRLIAQCLTVESDREAVLEIGYGIDADTRTSGYDHLMDRHFAEENGMLLLGVSTDRDDRVEVASRLLCAPESVCAHDVSQTARAIRGRARFALQPGRPVNVHRMTAYACSRDPEDAPTAREILDGAIQEGYDRQRDAHCQSWAEKWSACDVEIEGCDTDQLALRVSLYHLLRANPESSEVAIDAKGYAGDAYFGRFFWDTEMYLMPFFLYTHPDVARSLMEFRINTLAGARRNAHRYGYPGARFAWESDNRGDENCPAWEYCDHEVHVTADIVYALAHVAANCPGDPILNDAAELIVETCRYWVARCDTRPGDAHPSLLGVMGPDEYALLVDNHAYTNRMVKFALELAASDLSEKGGASNEERDAFRRLAEGLPVLRAPFNEDLVLQSENFHKRVDPDFDTFWKDRNGLYASRVSQERLYRSKNLKQADVLLLQWLFAQEFSEAECAAAWDYYVPVTTHDSSLSAGIHSIVASRLGKTSEAYEFWLMSSRLDLEGGAAQGIHIAGAAANWMMAVFGFAGMKPAMESDVLSLNPKLPEAWKRLRFPISWKGQRLQFDITHDKLTVHNGTEAPMPARIRGRDVTLPVGESHYRLFEG